MAERSPMERGFMDPLVRLMRVVNNKRVRIIVFAGGLISSGCYGC
jgi:hypothetical protein